MRKTCQKQPIVCGYIPTEDIYEPLKLMQSVIMKTNEVCLRYLENSTLCTLPSPGPSYNVVTCCAMKNIRRKMEDRHTIINDLNTIFNDQEASPSSYYAIFDGHDGHDAAAYSAAHLHQFLAESRHFVSNPEQALIDAFCKTDALFIEKCKTQNFSSGTTAVCALLRPKEKSLYIAWVGDSQALIANQGKILQCVNPHKPFRPDEKKRIENEGGMIMYWGTWRINGQLAVSRAIGDIDYKPLVIAVPEVREIPLSGSEDFIILACDGLWDFLSEEDAAMLVYKMVFDNPDDTESISQRLVQLSKEQGSTDNISVIVVFLREPTKIASDCRNSVMMDAGLDNATSNNPFTNSNEDIQNRMLGFLMKSNNGTMDADPMCNLDRNGKRSAADEFDDDDNDDDLGPETDVDTLDDVPVKVYEKMEMDVDQKFETELMEMDKSQRREETPTPPAHEVLEAGLVDNVGDSGEESEDEWNYYKGDKENINAATIQQQQQFVSAEISAVSPVVQRVDEEDEEEANNMSQLNPDAAEFVPISPTRSVDSPVCRALVEESILSQSPRRVTKNVDINLPKLNDFVQEAKNRPSGCFSNGHENGHELSSQELMENFLNGKNMEEIDNQQTSTPSKIAGSDEFHFGPNAALFSPSRHLFDQSEALSTKATFGGDDSNLSIHSSIIGDSKQETDPMSMSFYQDKDEENPFDLNKVHVLPENLEEYLNQEQTTDLDKAEVCELPKTPEPTMDENLCGDEENLQNTTVEVSKSPELCAKSPELSEQDDMLCAKTPEISAKEELVCSLPEKDDFDCSKSPAFSDKEDLVCAKSPAFSDRDEYVKSPEVDLLCPIVCEKAKSPLSEFDSEAKSPEPELCAIKSPEPEMPKEYETEPIDAAKSPEPEMPVPQSPDYEIIDAKFEQKSPEPIICRMETPELSSEQINDLPEAEVCQDADSEVCDMLKSMEPELLVTKTPEPEVCTLTPAETPDSERIASPEVEFLKASEPEVCAMKSPEPELCEMKSPEPEICEMKSPEPEICEMKSPESELCEMPQTTESEVRELNAFEPEVCEMQSTGPTIGDINLRNPELCVPESLMFVSKTETCEMQSPEEPESCETPEPAIRVMRTPEPELCAAKSPKPEICIAKTPEPEVCDIKSPEPEHEISELKSPELKERELKSPEQDVCELKSPELEVCELKSPEPEVCELKSPEPDVCELKSPEPDVCELKSPEPEICELKSLEPEVCELKSPQPEIKSPEPEVCEMKSPEPEVCEMKSPEPEICQMKSPEPEVCEMKSPEPEVCDLKSPEPQLLEPNLIEDKLPELNAALSPEPEMIKSPVSDMSIPLDVKSPEEEEKLSPLEDITSSVKDEAEVMSPIDLNYAQELSSAVQENITSEMSSPLESKDFAPKQTDLLEDIVVPPANVCEYPLKTVEKQAEEAEKPVAEPATNEASIVPEAVGAAAAAVVAATAVAAAATTKTEKDKKPAAKAKPSTLTPKKPTAMKTTATPTKTSATPTRTTPKPPMRATPKSATKTLTSPTKAAAPRTPTTPKLAARTTVGASPKPKTLSTSLSASKSAEKKPLTNGDVKPALAAKKLTSTTKTTSTTSAPRPTATRLSPTKPPTARSTLPPASKPLTAARTSSTTAAPKPRPATGLSKTTTTTTRTTTTKTTPPIGATRTAAKPASTTASKTSTTTAAAPRARVPLSKPAAKAPDAEKQIKENVNKATRTTTRTIGSTATAGKTSTTTVRKTETKTVGNVRSATSKTTTLTSAKIGLKKAPAPTKTTTTTKTAVSKISAKPKENGLLTNGGVTEEITTTTTMITNSDSHELLKDLSPVENFIQDNSQLVDTSSIAAD